MRGCGGGRDVCEALLDWGAIDSPIAVDGVLVGGMYLAYSWEDMA